MNTAPKLQELQSRLEQVALRLDPSNSKPIASTLSSFRQVTDEVRNISASLAALAPPSGEGVIPAIDVFRIAGELIAKYEIRQRNFGGLKANEWAIGSHQQISDFLDDLRTLATPPPASLEREDNWPENLPAWRK